MQPDPNRRTEMVQGGPSSGVSVIICAYTEKRWDDLLAAVQSVRGQTTPAMETIVVIDHNPALLQRARDYFSAAITGETDLLVIENRERQGLSGARNTGTAAARGEILAFLDDDAAAEPNWLSELLAGYRDPAVMGVGGFIQPLWLSNRPGWFPEEFNWVVGCTYLGTPIRDAPVRNLIGANMSFRREVFAQAGGFRTEMGRVGTFPAGCEETELCIRARQLWPAKTLLYRPSARVKHRVPGPRGSAAYFFSRCFAEGLSKAAVARLVGAGDGLSTERNYTLHTLPRGILRGISTAVRGHTWRGRWAGLGQAAAIAAGVAVTAAGYASGSIRGWVYGIGNKGRKSSLTETQSTPAFPPGTGHPLRPAPRVLMVTPRYFPLTGGVENHVYQVARRMAGQGLDVTVLTTDSSRRLPAHEVIDGVQIERVPAWPANRDYYFAPQVYSRILRGGWDLIHIQSYHTLVPPLAMLAALRAHIPYVVTFHGGGHNSGLRNAVRGFQRRLLRPLLARAERLVALANFEIEQYGRELGVPADRFILLPNGCDLPQLDFPAEKGEGTLIASVGRLERYKGHRRTLAAMPEILKRCPDARLWIAGTGPDEPALRQLAQDLGVQDRVDIRAIPGSDRQAMAAALSKADLFVLLSDFETHPIAVLEALALGVPALVAHTSGLAELADRGYAASIPLASSPAQIADAVLAQIAHPILPAGLDLPTWDDCAAGLLGLYWDIIQVDNPYAHINALPVLSPHSGRN